MLRSSGSRRTKTSTKASRRDLAAAIARGSTAATTVAATMFLAHRVQIRFLATGGIGGVHRRAEQTGDVSADLVQLANTPVAVMSAGAKSILDLPRTLELLETLGVPVVGYRTDEFPAFYSRSSGRPVSTRVDTVGEAAALLSAHWRLDGTGILIVQPVEESVALDRTELDAAVAEAERQASAHGVRGPSSPPTCCAISPRRRLEEPFRANQALVLANARLAAQIACAMDR